MDSEILRIYLEQTSRILVSEDVFEAVSDYLMKKPDSNIAWEMHRAVDNIEHISKEILKEKLL